MKSGVFRPPGNLPQHDYAGLRALVAETREAMGKLTPEEINGLEDNDVTFECART